MKVQSVMKKEVVTVSQDSTFGEALTLMVERRVGLLPVLDGDRRLVGVLSLREAMNIVLPDIVDWIQDLDFVEDFGAVERAPLEDSLRRRPIRAVMEPALSVREDAGLIGTYTYLRQHELSDVAVVDASNHLVGVASWVDVGVGFLRDRLRSGGDG